MTNSAGALLPGQYAERVRAFRQALKPETEVGVHTHHNLTLGVANAVAGIEAGAVRSTPRSPAWAPARATRRSRR